MENTETNTPSVNSTQSVKIDRRGKNPNSLANLSKRRFTSVTATEAIKKRWDNPRKPITDELRQQVNELVAKQLAKSMIRRAKKDTYTMNTLMDRVDGPIVHQQQIDVNCNLAVLIAEARARIKDDE